MIANRAAKRNNLMSPKTIKWIEEMADVLFYVFCCLGEVKNSTPSAFGAKSVAAIGAAHHTLHISEVIPSLNSAKREKVFLTSSVKVL